MKHFTYLSVVLMLCIFSFSCKTKSLQSESSLGNVDPISYIEGKNDAQFKLVNSTSPQVPNSIVKLEEDMDRRAQIMAEERKLKGEKPLSDRINDTRIMEKKPNGNPEGKIALDKLTPKCRFAYWYTQFCVEYYYAYYHQPPKDLEELIEKNYLPVTLTDDEIASVTNVLKLHGWNLNDKSIALREIRFEKMQTKPSYSKEEFEARLPYFMFNHSFQIAMNNYITDTHNSFKPNLSDMYEFIRTEMGVNDKFWSYLIDSSNNPKGEIFFIKEGSEEKVPANVKLDKPDLLITYHEYSNSDCGCDDIPPVLLGKVSSISICMLF